MKKILMTGDAGYIGSVLKDELIKNKYEVRCYDIRHLSVMDIRNYDYLETQIIDGKPDFIIHLAGIVGDPNCALNITHTYDTNVKGTINVIKLCKEYDIPLIFASSCSVYGKKDGIVDEDESMNPLSLYALTKQINEEDIKKELTKYIIFRFGTLYGDSPAIRYDLVVNGMTKQAIEKGEITVFGGKQTRPFISTKELSKTITKVMGESAWGEIYNLVEINMSIMDLAKVIGEETGCKIEVENRITDKRDYSVSNSKVSKFYKPKMRLREEIKAICKKLKKQ